MVQFQSLLAPELRSFVTHDPAESLRKVKVPVLAMNGARDLQVPPQQNLPAIAAALAAGGNPDFTIVELPGLNHLFQDAKTGAISEYAEIEETISPIALDRMSNWILKQSGVPAGGAVHRAGASSAAI